MIDCENNDRSPSRRKHHGEETKMKTLILVGVIFIGVATVLGIISTAIPYWLVSSISHQGLWQVCVSNLLSDSDTCYKVSIGDASDWWRAVQALTVIGIVCLALGALFACFYLRNESLTKYSTFSALPSATGGVLFVLAVIIYGAKNKDATDSSLFNFGAGFYLGIVTAVAALIAALFIVLSKRAAGYSSI